MEVGNGNGTTGVVGQAGRFGTVVDWDGQRGGAGDTGGWKYQQTIYVSWVCFGVPAFLRGEVGAKYMGWYVRPI